MEDTKDHVNEIEVAAEVKENMHSRFRGALRVLLVTAIGAGALVAYLGVSSTSGQESPSSRPVLGDPPIGNEITVQSVGVYANGTFRRFTCKADGVLVVSDSRISEIKAAVPRLALKLGDRVDALKGKTGAFLVSLSASGAIMQGPRDCVEMGS